MAKYAADTEVSSDRSLAEIKTTLTKYGATKFGFLECEDRAAIGFEFQGRRIRFDVPLPNRLERRFLQSNHIPPRALTIDEQHKRWEQACRQRWRALSLAIKAKLEVVESGIATFEEEFLAYVALPNGQTVGEFLRPQIETAYASGRMPALLPAMGETGNIN